MGVTLTHQQQAAVDNRGGELLVSAAAGSGKTRILVERLLDRVQQEHLDLDRFLVITYTKAAAAELRGKIMDELNDRLAADPGNAFLHRQKLVIYRAQISPFVRLLCGRRGTASTFSPTSGWGTTASVPF